MAQQDAFLDEIDALIEKHAPTAAPAAPAPADQDPVLAEVDAILAPYEVQETEREATAKALEVGKWPGDESIRPTIEKGGRKAFDAVRDARIPQMRQVHKARETETALRDADSFTNRATAFAKSLFGSEEPAPIAQTAPLPVPAGPSLSPSPLHTPTPRSGPLPVQQLVSNISKEDKSAAGDVVLAYKRRQIDLDEAHRQLLNIYGRYTDAPDQPDQFGHTLRDMLAQTKRRPENPEAINSESLPPIAAIVERYKAANPLEQGPKVGPDKLHPFERASEAPPADQADDSGERPDLILPEIVVRPDDQASTSPSWLQPGLAKNYEQPEVLAPSMERASMPTDAAAPSQTTIGQDIAEAASNFMRGAADVTGSALKSIAIASKTVDEYLPEALKNPADIKERMTYKIGQAVQDMAANAFPTDPARQKEFMASVLPRALGSMTAFLAGGIGGAVVKAPMTTTALMGAGAQGTEQFEDAAAHGADPATQQRAFWMGVPVGATEAIPIGGLIEKFNNATGGRFMHILKTAGVAAAEEFAQEFFQTTAGNVIAKDILEYDTQRSRIEGATEAGEAGGAAGAILGILVGALGGRRAMQQRTGAADVPAANEPLAQGSPASAPATVSAPPPIEGVPPQPFVPAPMPDPRTLKRNRPATVQTPAAVERPAPIEQPAPQQRPAPVMKGDAITPEMREAMDYVNEYEVEERPTPVERPKAETKPAPVETTAHKIETKGPIIETPAPVERPPESRAEIAPAQEAAPLPIEASTPVEKPEVATAKPTPDRTRSVFLGKSGNRKITFEDPIHAELFDFTSALKKSIAGDKSVDIADRTSRLKKQLGLPDDANVGAVAQTYRKQILEQAKAAGAGQTIAAPAPQTGPPSTSDIAPAVMSETPSPVDIAAHEAATSPQNDKKPPTLPQIKAGNYEKGHETIMGLDLSFENPAGSTRSGTDKAGKPWSQIMQDHYGYIRGTKGKDKDHIDVFVAPETPKDWDGPVYVVDQVDPSTGQFDEHKVILGARTLEAAKQIYKRNYAKDWQGMGEVSVIPNQDYFKKWLKEGNTTKPFADYYDAQEAASNAPAALPVPAKPTAAAPMPTAPDSAEFDYTATKKRPTTKQVMADWKKAGKPKRFTVEYGETYAEFEFLPDTLAKGWDAHGNGAGGFKRDEILKALQDEQLREHNEGMNQLVDRLNADERAALPVPAKGEASPGDIDLELFVPPQRKGDPGSIVKMKGELLPEIKQVRAAIHPTIGNGNVPLKDKWTVSEVSSGAALATHKDRETAISLAKSALKKAEAAGGQELIQKRINEKIEESNAIRKAIAAKAAKDKRAAEPKAPAPIAVPSPNFQDVRYLVVQEEKAFARATTTEERQKHLDRVTTLKREYLAASKLTATDYKSREKFFDDTLSRMNNAELNSPLPPAAKPAELPAPAQGAAPAPIETNTQKVDDADPATAGNNLADFVADQLEAGNTISAQGLFDQANRFYGGTTAEGKYTPKDAYDALELGVNKYIAKSSTFSPDAAGTVAAARAIATKLRDLLDKLPTQTRRTEEQVEFQQFSTPPDLAFLMAWASAVHRKDTALEPSAGLGGLAIFAHEAGAKVVLNEYNDRRAALLKKLNIGTVYQENAEQLDNILPASVKPTVVIMNPPFSSTAGRIPGQRKTANGIMHLEQALARLEPGGRLVALIGKGKMHADPQVLEDWISNTAKTHAYRARIGLSGKGYKKYGTDYSNQILIFDKITPDGRRPVIADFDDVLDALPSLKEVRDARPLTSGTAPAKQSTTQSDRSPVPETGTAATGPDTAVSAATPAVGTGQRKGDAADAGLERPAPRKPGQSPGKRSGTGDAVSGEQSGRPAKPAASAKTATQGDESAGSRASGDEQSGSPTDGGSGSRLPADAVSSPKLTLEAAPAKGSRPKKGELTDSVYEDYVPAKFRVKGAKPHPGKLAESAALAAVEPTDITYRPHLAQDLIERGELSLAQLEAVAYAGQAHSQTLPTGERKGFFLGDGPGVGKGRTIAGMIMDNWNQGRKKAVWVSETQNLYNSAIRDWTALGGKQTDLHVTSKFALGEEIKLQQGLVFSTYSTLASGLEVTKLGTVKAKGVKGGKPDQLQKTRLDQLANWLGPDYDGIIIFDEAHNMQNAQGSEGEMGGTDPAARALAGIELQTRFPKARFVYSSATGATKVEALAYLERLGLWGEGTPFPSKNDFLGEISSAGLGAMEIVAQNLKSMGSYISRNLSYDGVTFDKIEHQLTPEQTEIYNEMARAWQLVLQNVNKALEATGVTGTTKTGSVKTKNGIAKMRAMSKFWGTQQSFYNQILNSMQMPSVIADMKARLAKGEALIVQLTNTNEAATGREIERMEKEGSDIESLDLTPRQGLMNYVRHAFPVAQMEDFMDANGKIRTRMVTDSQGRPVENKAAVKMREDLLDRLGSLRVPEGPIDIILNTFGPDMVAEVTGRQERILRYEKDGEMVNEHQKKRTEHVIRQEAKEFMDDKRRILVFSEKGGTGESYHADLSKKNQRKRAHYLVQAGWRADKAIQGLGRSHRTNQKQPPHYILTMTNIKGHKRFISTIARRLDETGALTKGSRQAGSSGLISAKDNLENRYATGAIKSLVMDTFYKQDKSISFDTLTTKLGLTNLVDKDGALVQGNIPDVPRYMNRLLSLELHDQNAMFDAFMSRMDRLVEIAAQNGTLDTGMETYRADAGITELSRDVVYRDPTSGAPTNLVHLEAKHKTLTVPAAAIEDGPFTKYVKNNRTGKVFAAADLGQRTQEDGSIKHQFKLSTHVLGRYLYAPADEVKRLYTDIDKKEGRKAWDAQIAAEDPTYSEKFYMVTGTLLNIWDKLPKEHNAKIRRLQTDDGTKHLGRMVTEAQAQTIKTNLGVAKAGDAPTLTPAEYFESVIDKGASLHLSNGWQIKRVRVANEPRIEVVGDNLAPHREVLLKQGAFTERVGFTTRFFIPTGNTGAGVLERILKSQRVVKFLQAAKQAIGNERGSIPLGQLVPGRTDQRNDLIQGLGPNEVVKFDEPDAETRFLAAKEGVKPERAADKIREVLQQIAHSTREFPTLPDTAEYSPLRTSLLTLQKQKGIAADRVIRRLDRITGKLGPKMLDLFTRKVILDDLSREADLDRDLPFGLTKESVERNLAEIDRLVSQNPDVAEAVQARADAWTELKTRYGRAMRAIGQDRLADRLNKENYFRHQVLEYAQTRQRTPAGTGKELKSPTGRGFLRQRRGSTLDINANYLQADFEVMAQMEHDVEVAKTIRLVDRQYNIRPELERKAKQANEQSLKQIIARERQALFGDVAEGEITSPTPTEAQLKEFAKQIAMGLSKVRKAMQIPKEGIISFAQLASWAEDTESPANGGARQALKGISGRREFVKQLLGRNFKTWEDVIPEGYTTWQPEQGNVLFLAESIPAQLARQLQEAILPSVNITAEQLRKVMAMGGPKEQYVVDMNVHDTLRSMARPIPTWWQDSIRSAQGHWKQLMLLSPRRVIRYNLRNITGDADAVFAGNPKAFRRVGSSLVELWPVFFGKTKELTGEVKEWFDRGGFQSTLQAQEMGDLNELRLFRSLLEKEAHGGIASLPAKVINGYWTKARLATDYREAMLRYANYREYLAQMQANPTGRPDNFGASIPENVLALPDLRDRAYKLSNELLGAYDRVSVVGQNLRNYWIPFFSWTEVNFRRYKQLTKNAFKDIGAAQLSRFGLVGAGKSLKWLIRFSALWTVLQVVNNLMFPDEERELDEATRNKPHIIFGRDEKGKILYLSGLGALGDLLSWFGLDEAPALTADVMHGRLTPGEALKNVVKAPINKVVQGITPLVKVPAEIFARESTYPDVFRPRAIQDPWEYAAQQVTLGPEYRKLTGQPSRSVGDELSGLVVQRQDPGSAAYGDWQNIEEKWLARFGKTKGVHFRGEKSTAIRNIARSIQEGDAEAEARWREKFEQLGGTIADIKRSVRSLAPLSGVTKKERDTILAGIDQEEREILRRAEAYYKTHMLQVLPELERRKLLGRLTKQGWLRPEEPTDAAPFPLE